MWSDPIADMLTRIRNATGIKAANVAMPTSNLKVAVAKVLADEGYIRGYDETAKGKEGRLRIELKYGERGEPVIQDIRRVSKPGCRVYRGSGELPRVLNGLGIAIVSTSQGVLSDRDCRRRKVGGEVLCTVY
jgi:small subunit ribosomal protein S8